MSPEQLREFVAVMRDLGVSTFESGDLKITLGAEPARALPPRDPNAPRPPPKKAYYDALLFACTEGLPEDFQGDD